MKLNREAWLTRMAKLAEPLFIGLTIPPYKVTCGWPSKSATARKRRVGECHAPTVSKAGMTEMFISPVLDKLEDVTGTLCHEMAHVIAGVQHAHREPFKRICRHVGLTRGKPTEIMPGEQLEKRLCELAAKIGEPYPHAALVVTPPIRSARAATTVKLACACGFTCRCSVKALDGVGALPVCGCGLAMTYADEGEDDAED